MSPAFSGPCSFSKAATCAGLISGDAGQDFAGVLPTSAFTSIARTGPQVQSKGTFSVVIELVARGLNFFSYSASQPRTSGEYSVFAPSGGRENEGGTRCVPAIESIMWA